MQGIANFQRESVEFVDNEMESDARRQRRSAQSRHVGIEQTLKTTSTSERTTIVDDCIIRALRSWLSPRLGRDYVLVNKYGEQNDSTKSSQHHWHSWLPPPAFYVRGNFIARRGRTFMTAVVRAGRSPSESGIMSDGDDRIGLLRAAWFVAECRRFATARNYVLGKDWVRGRESNL